MIGRSFGHFALGLDPSLPASIARDVGKLWGISDDEPLSDCGVHGRGEMVDKQQDGERGIPLAERSDSCTDILSYNVV